MNSHVYVLQRRDAEDLMKNEKLATIAVSNGIFVDASVVCAASLGLNIYFGSFSNTLKGRYIEKNPQVSATMGMLQLHGMARLVPKGSEGYAESRQAYDAKFPQYVWMFDLPNNHLYKIEPLVIWRYAPGKGPMSRELLVIDEKYYAALGAYEGPEHELSKADSFMKGGSND